MSTDEDRASRPMPLYARVLRLRRLRIGGLASFVFLECTVAAGVLLALAELVSWWAVPLLPLLVAAVVKINDMVGGPSREPADEDGEWGVDDLPGNLAFAGAPRLARAGGRRHGRDGGLALDDGFADLRADQHTDLGEIETVRRGVVTRAPGRDGVPAARTAAGARGVPGQVLSGRPLDQGWDGADVDQGRGPQERRTVERNPHGSGRGTSEQAAGGAEAQPPEPAAQPQRQPPTRAHVIGAAVRRSMAVQSQYGRTPATQQGSGRHARQEAGVAGRRSGTNERGFGRSV